MDKKTDASKEPMIFANRAGRVAELKQWVGSVFAGKKTYCLISVSGYATTAHAAFEDVPREVTRALIVFEDIPVDMSLVD